jgi:hypothetical protein
MLSKQPLARPRSVPALLREIDAIRTHVDLSGDNSRPRQSALGDRSAADTMEMDIDAGSNSP